MKIKCQREEILDGIQTVQSIVSAKGALPILSNVLLETEGDTLTLTTTDLEVGLRKSIRVKVIKQGAITLPAKRLAAILRELPVSDVTLETSDEKEAVIRYSSSFFRVLGLPKNEFPPLPNFQKSRSFKVGEGALKQLVRKTHYAVSHDESRYVLNGLYLLFSKGRIDAVATDGRRLAFCELDADVPAGIDRGIIVPTKAILELGRILSDEGEIELSMGENQVAFGGGDWMLLTRLIEGHFPNYQQVIPQKSEYKLLFDREEFLAAVRRVALLTSEQSNSIKLSFRKNRLVISTNTPEVGEAREELTISYAGKEIDIAFNPQYVMDVLKNLDENEVTFEMTDALHAGVIKVGKAFLYVLMPIRLT
jgi:DNA polymerase-3 subunit beta